MKQDCPRSGLTLPTSAASKPTGADGALGGSIDSFSGAYRWLSNFWPCTVELDGVAYPSVENAYQAAKTTPQHRKPFETCSAAQAKRLGRENPMRSDWDRQKIAVMQDLLAQKSAHGTPLGDQLKATGDVPLIEGNHWADRFWGMCNGEGKNHLGRLLMERRSLLQYPQLDFGEASMVNKTTAASSTTHTIDLRAAPQNDPNNRSNQTPTELESADAWDAPKSSEVASRTRRPGQLSLF